jgi:hypothetical protein
MYKITAVVEMSSGNLCCIQQRTSVRHLVDAECTEVCVALNSVKCLWSIATVVLLELSRMSTAVVVV